PNGKAAGRGGEPPAGGRSETDAGLCPPSYFAEQQAETTLQHAAPAAQQSALGAAEATATVAAVTLTALAVVQQASTALQHAAPATQQSALALGVGFVSPAGDFGESRAVRAIESSITRRVMVGGPVV